MFMYMCVQTCMSFGAIHFKLKPLLSVSSAPPRYSPSQYPPATSAVSTLAARAPPGGGAKGGAGAEFISDEDLSEIAGRILMDWQHLGIKLKVPYSKLESFRTKHHSSSEQAAREMLGYWQATKGKAATRRALREALEGLGYGRLVEEIFRNDR